MSIWSLLFSYKGRIRRSTFWLTVGVRILVIAVCIYVVFFNEPIHPIVAILFVLLGLLALYVGRPIATKRWNDRDGSSCWGPISWIPGIGSLWAIID